MIKGQWRLVALILTTWISLGASIIWKVGYDNCRFYAI